MKDLSQAGEVPCVLALKRPRERPLFPADSVPEKSRSTPYGSLRSGHAEELSPRRGGTRRIEMAT